jgi:HEAT repeat protein
MRGAGSTPGLREGPSRPVSWTRVSACSNVGDKVDNVTLGSLNDWVGLAALIAGVFVLWQVAQWWERRAQRRPGVAEPYSPMGAVGLLGPTVSKLRYSGDVPGLIHALSNSSAGVRQAAAEALGHFDDPRGVESLIFALQDSDSGVRRAAVGALGLIAANGAGRIVDPRLSNPAAKPSPRAAEGLASMLRDPDAGVRKAASDALGLIGEVEDDEAVPALIAALADPDADVRKSAAEALGALGDEDAVPALVGDLASPDSRVRWTAASALGNIGWEPETNDARVLYWVAKRQWAECVHLGAAAVDLLIWVLGTEGEDMVRTQILNGAAGALGEIRDPRAVPALIGLLDDPQDTVRWSASMALSDVGWQPTNDAHGAAFWAARGEWNKCVEIGAASVGPLLYVVRDTHLYPVAKRVAAAGAIGDIRDPSAVDALIAALSEVPSAAEALGAIGDPRAAGPLRARLADPHLTATYRATLREALAKVTSGVSSGQSRR